MWAVVKKDSGDGVCHAKYALPAGVLMGFNNYLTLALASKLNASVLFPIVSVANIAIVWLIGILFFKEKLTVLQTIGLILGVSSIVLLKL